MFVKSFNQNYHLKNLKKLKTGIWSINFITKKVLSIIADHMTKLLFNQLYNNMIGMMYLGKKLIFIRDCMI